MLYHVVHESRTPVVRVSPPHGTRARYLHRTLACRCPRCTGANAVYMRAYRARPERTDWSPRRWEQLTLEVSA